MESIDRNMASDPKKAPAAKKAITQEQIVAGFNQLRQEQRTISGQVVELESDANEHGYVLTTCAFLSFVIIQSFV